MIFCYVLQDFFYPTGHNKSVSFTTAYDNKFNYPDLSRNILDFCAVLRLQGFNLGPEETQDAMRALQAIDMGNFKQFRAALQMVLCSSQEQEKLFDILFRAYFLLMPEKEVPPESQALADAGQDGGDKEEAPQKSKSPKERPPQEETSQDSSLGDIEAGDNDQDSNAGAILQTHFSPFANKLENPITISQEGADEMLGAARELINRVRLGRSRRWKAMTHGKRYNFRRTLRKSLQTGGEAIKPAWLGHPLRKPKFVLLLDGSRSMAGYCDRLLQFAQALSQRSSRVEVFLFSTELKRVSMSLRRSKGQALKLSDLGEAWGGGTKIGSCLYAFTQQYGAGLLDRDTVVLIASDGLDTGDLKSLETAMRELRRCAASVVWLNPLLSSKGYEPSAGGMKTALPFVDTFATADDAASFSLLAQKIQLRR
jgi:uncharacterized protein